MAEFIDFASLKRPSTPNTFLLAPEGLCQVAQVDQTSPSWDIPAETLFAECLSQIDAEDLWAVQGQSAQSFQLVFVARTRLLRFKDDVDLRVIPSDDGRASCKVAIYSRSRIGRSDLGANAKRVSSLLEKLPKSIKAT
ncbi:MAG: DUF1499 domain-containing protein [Pseudomonadota bacterium]